MGYFNVKFRPDMINGDTTQLVADNGDQAAFAANDVLFDWHAIDIPKGSARVQGITVVMNGSNGNRQSERDIQFVFAKSIDGVAPPTLGVVNATATALGTQNHIIGAFVVDSTVVTGLDPYSVFGACAGPAPANGLHLPVLEGEESTTQKGFQTIYVGGIITGVLNFDTNVLANGAIDASADLANTIVVDTTDARKAFAVGDLAYVRGVDTQVPGVITKVEQLKLTFSETNSTVDADNNIEILNATPIKITLHFED